MNESYNQGNTDQGYIDPAYGQMPNYSQPLNYNQPPVRPKGDGVGFGIASLALGVASFLLFCCCVNYILAILAIVFGVVQMAKNKAKGMAIAGIVTAGISIILATVLWIGVALNVDRSDLQNYNFYNEYDEYNPYNQFFEDYINEL